MRVDEGAGRPADIIAMAEGAAALEAAGIDATLADKRHVLSFLRGVPLADLPPMRAAHQGEEEEGPGEFRELVGKVQDLTEELQRGLKREQLLQAQLKTLEVSLHAAEHERDVLAGGRDETVTQVGVQLRQYWEREMARREQEAERVLAGELRKQEALDAEARHAMGLKLEAVRGAAAAEVEERRRTEDDLRAEIASLVPALAEETARAELAETKRADAAEAARAEAAEAARAEAAAQLEAQEAALAAARAAQAQAKEALADLSMEADALAAARDAEAARAEAAEAELERERAARAAAEGREEELRAALAETRRVVGGKDAGLAAAIESARDAMGLRNAVLVQPRPSLPRALPCAGAEARGRAGMQSRLNAGIEECEVQAGICAANSRMLPEEGLQAIADALGDRAEVPPRQAPPAPPAAPPRAEQGRWMLGTEVRRLEREQAETLDLGALEAALATRAPKESKAARRPREAKRAASAEAAEGEGGEGVLDGARVSHIGRLSPDASGESIGSGEGAGSSRASSRAGSARYGALPLGPDDERLGGAESGASLGALGAGYGGGLSSAVPRAALLHSAGAGGAPSSTGSARAGGQRERVFGAFRVPFQPLA